MFSGNAFDSEPRTYAPSKADAHGYVFEAENLINFKSLVIMKRFDGMRDRYKGLIIKKMLKIMLMTEFLLLIIVTKINVGDRFGFFDHRNSLSHNISLGHIVPKMSL